MAPPGIKLLAYETTTQRRTWAKHGVEAWYIGYDPDHYRCHKCYLPSTNVERIANTVSFFPHDFAVPMNDHQDNLIRSIRDITAALKHRYLHTPLQPVGDEQFEAIKKLEYFLSRTSTPASATGNRTQTTRTIMPESVNGNRPPSTQISRPESVTGNQTPSNQIDTPESVTGNQTPIT